MPVKSGFHIIALSLLIGLLPISAADQGDWNLLISKLPKSTTIQAAFNEVRTSPLRKRPSVLSGTLRYSVDHGLSLHYKEPLERIIFIQGDSIELRDDEGGRRTLPDDERYAWIPDLIGAIFSFDLDRWKDSFELRSFTEQEGIWEAYLEPKNDSSRDQIRSLTIKGDTTYISEMLLKMKGGRDVEIRVVDAKTDIVFDEQVLGLYF
ncbi:MAG: outer membrane lipoprotein carrier protein LolA [Opitutales bacterium]|nr:outer membrane lipoprotein carrier protein LolA [Opitutales bacterium]NRA26997.1 outer membrane lipoprotein carrier protein LolA [Opitutales bacterium]